MEILRPNKFTNIDLSVIGLSAEILRLLQKNPYQKYSQLLDKVILKKGESAKENFLLTLGFLFSIGKIEYYPQHDIVELKKTK